MSSGRSTRSRLWARGLFGGALATVVGAAACEAQTLPAAHTAHSAQTVAGPTADEIIARNVAARGGLERIKAVQTARIWGTISFRPGVAHPLATEMARPGRIRSEISAQGQTLVQAFDGHGAWSLDPTEASGVAQVMPPDAAKNVAAGADMDGPLVDYSAKGNRVTLVGMDTADGRSAYKIAVTTASGLHDVYYIDSRSYMQTKWEGERVSGGKPVVYESYFRDYRPIDGVMWAFRIDSDTKGQPGAQHIVTDSIRLNRPVLDARFAMPTAAAGAPARD